MNWVSELKVFYASEKDRVRSPSPHANQTRCVLFIYIVCQGMILLNELLLEKMRVVSNFVVFASTCFSINMHRIISYTRDETSESLA